MDIFCEKLSHRSYIFNPDKFYLLDECDRIRSIGVDYLRLIINNESNEDIRMITGLLNGVISGGRLNMEYYEYADKIKREGFTKGHFQRGV
jgi:hypothetical protein